MRSQGQSWARNRHCRRRCTSSQHEPVHYVVCHLFASDGTGATYEELTYPFHDQTILVTGCGRICFRRRKMNLSHVFAGQSVGVTQVAERT